MSSASSARITGAVAGAAFDARRQRTLALFRKWRQHGDRRARDQIVECYMPLARRLAWRYESTSAESIEDLLQVAYLGLLLAMDRFDPDRGVPFAGFVIPTVLGELRRHLRNTGWSVHVPRAAQELALKVGNARLQISARTGRSPTVTDLAQYLEISTENVLVGLQAAAARYGVSLDARADGGDESAEPLGALIGSEDERYELIETAVSVAGAMGRLTVSERQALGLRVVHGCKQKEIGRQLGCSQMQAFRLLRSAAAKLQLSPER